MKLDLSVHSPALIRAGEQLAQRLPHQRHLVAEPHVAAEQQQAGPVRRVREVLRVPDGLHRVA